MDLFLSVSFSIISLGIPDESFFGLYFDLEDRFGSGFEDRDRDRSREYDRDNESLYEPVLLFESLLESLYDLRFPFFLLRFFFLE